MATALVLILKKITELFTSKKRTLDIENISSIDETKLPKKTQLNLFNRHGVLCNKKEFRSWKEVLNDEIPTIMHLDFLKKRWRFQIAQKKAIGYFIRYNKNAHLNYLSTHFSSKKTNDSYFAIIKICENVDKNLLNFWIVFEGRILQVPVSLNQIVYLASNKIISDFDSYRTVNKILPRSRFCKYLYEIAYKDTEVSRIFKKIMDFSISEHVIGVYESQMTKIFRSILTYGVFNKFTNAGFKKLLLKKEMVSDDFNPAFDKKNSFDYLLKMNSLIIYYCKGDSFGIFGVFETSKQQAHIFLLMTGKEIMVNNIDHIYANILKTMHKETENIPNILPIQFSFKTEVSSNFQSITKKIIKIIALNSIENTIIFSISSIAKNQLIKEWPVLNSFYIQQIKSNLSSDRSEFNSLDWQNKQVKRLFREVVVSCNSIQSLMFQSTFYNIPIGNLPSSDSNLTFVFDCCFSRFLNKHDQITWFSQTNRPDFGNFGLVDESWIKQPLKPFVNQHSGFYPTLTLELIVDGLEISSILMSNRLFDQDQMFNDSSTSYNQPMQKAFIENYSKNMIQSIDQLAFCDEISSSLPAMKHLKSFILSLVANIGHKDALNHLNWFYQWIVNKHSLMYDPAIAFQVNNFMKRYMELLTDNLKKYGLNVVYYDLKKIIINSSRPKLNEAWNHIRYSIEKIIQHNDLSTNLFRHIKIYPKSGWYLLFWLDEHNNGGIRVDLPADADDFNADDIYSNDPNIEMNWKIIDNLPSKEENVKQLFNSIISTHIFSINKIIIEWFQIHKTDLIDDQLSRHNFGSLTSLIIEHNHNRIIEEISNQLYIGSNSIKSLATTITDGLNSLSLLYQTVFLVLRLDSCCSNQINKLKREICTINNLKQMAHSDESNVMSEQLSFVLPQFICEKCGFFRDIDLCSDLFIKSNQNEQEDLNHINDGYSLFCSECIEQYDKDHLEIAFIEQLNLIVEQFLDQDLKCSKCHTIRYGDMDFKCTCSFPFEFHESITLLKHQIKSSNHVIKNFKFDRSNLIIFPLLSLLH